MNKKMLTTMMISKATLTKMTKQKGAAIRSKEQGGENDENLATGSSPPPAPSFMTMTTMTKDDKSDQNQDLATDSSPPPAPILKKKQRGA